MTKGPLDEAEEGANPADHGKNRHKKSVLTYCEGILLSGFQIKGKALVTALTALR